jgi:two-component system nitrate/nitrite response regulator NarL
VSRVLRVAVAASNPLRRVNLLAVVTGAGHAVSETWADADAVLAEGIDTPGDHVPVVALGAADEGQAGLLTDSAGPEQIDAALRAVAAGLTVRAAAAARPTFQALAEEHSALLTPRELQVLAAISDGLSNKAAARRLGISQHTVKFHVESLLRKLGAASRTEAVRNGLRRGLIEV